MDDFGPEEALLGDFGELGLAVDVPVPEDLLDLRRVHGQAEEVGEVGLRRLVLLLVAATAPTAPAAPIPASPPALPSTSSVASSSALNPVSSAASFSSFSAPSLLSSGLPVPSSSSSSPRPLLFLSNHLEVLVRLRI